MTRSFYGQTAADYGSAPATVSGTANVNIFAGITVYMFDGDDYATCVAKTDLLDADGAGATSITGAAQELLKFQGPDDWHLDLYGCTDATPDADSVFYRFPPSTDVLTGRVVTLEAASNPDFGDQDNTNFTGIADGDVPVYVAATQTWVAGAGSGATGLPSGGAALTTLVKASATSYDVAWYTGSVPTVPITQTAYDALSTPRPKVHYVIVASV